MISFPLQMMLLLREWERSNAAVIRGTCPLISSTNCDSHNNNDIGNDIEGALPDPCFPTRAHSLPRARRFFPFPIPIPAAAIVVRPPAEVMIQNFVCRSPPPSAAEVVCHFAVANVPNG